MVFTGKSQTFTFPGMVFIWDFPVKPSLSVDKQLGFSPSLQYPKLSSVGVVGVTPVTKHLLDFSGYLSGWFNSYSQNQAACSGVLWGKRSLPIHRSWECVSTWSSHSGRSVNPWYFQFLPFTKQTWPHDWFFSICLYFFLSRRLCSKGEKSNSIMSWKWNVHQKPSAWWWVDSLFLLCGWAMQLPESSIESWCLWYLFLNSKK